MGGVYAYAEDKKMFWSSSMTVILFLFQLSTILTVGASSRCYCRQGPVGLLPASETSFPITVERVVYYGKVI